jgi:hypothetical protein
MAIKIWAGLGVQESMSCLGETIEEEKDYYPLVLS